jgi:hypothetical protein
MANTNLTIDQITREALRILVNNLGFARNTNKEYDASFANDGAKIGDTLRIRKPARYVIRTGAALNVQDHTETKVDLQLDTQAGVDVNFTSRELTLDISDFSERVLKPAMATVANKIDLDGLALYKDVYSSVGVLGTPPATAAILLDANQVMDEMATPRDGQRCLAVNPAGNASLVNGLRELFQSSGKLDAQYRKGMMGMDTLGFKEIYMDQNINTHTTGDQGADLLGAVNDTVIEGDSTISIDGMTSVGTVITVKKGDIFTIAGVYAVNPQSRSSTGSLQQFVVTADNSGTSSAITDVAVSPAFKAAGSFQTIDALPLEDAVVTFYGTTSSQSPQNIAYHPDAFTLGTADLLMPKGVDFASRQVHEGISMRIVRDYDINNDALPCRIDVLYGWKTLYPELACRIWG